jgi:hypothetical protein
VQWVAARLYQGQTTNFRTPGGGFAPVYSTVDASGRTLQGDAAAHASYVFLLDRAGDVHPVPHALYAAVAKGEASVPMLAGQTLRVADWYVRLKDGAPERLVNESYSLLQLDAQGHIDLSHSPAAHPQQAGASALSEDDSWPTAAQHQQMRHLLWGDAPDAAA